MSVASKRLSNNRRNLGYCGDISNRIYQVMNAIRRLREQAALTQEALARAAGTSQPTIAAYETGKKSPTLDTIQRMAAAAGFKSEVVYHRPLTREDRRSLALHRVIAERVADDPKGMLAIACRNLARMRSQDDRVRTAMRGWIGS